MLLDTHRENTHAHGMCTQSKQRDKCTNTHSGKDYRRKMSYPVLCPDHQWGWGWCWVGHCGRGGPFAVETWGDIQTGSQSPGPQVGPPPRQEGGEEGEGQRAPALPSRYSAVTSSVLRFTHRSLQPSHLTWEMENKIHTNTHTHTKHCEK